MNKEELQRLLEGRSIVGADFSGQTLEKVDFSGCTLERVNFKGATLVHCRFRGAKISWSDFRYAEIQHGTFEDARLAFCDFYRTFIDGIVIFSGSEFANCSLHKTYLGDCAVIRRENLCKGRILQQDREAYERFLVDWHTFGTGERKNDVGLLSDWSPESALRSRWADAEIIFKNFNALWTGKGYIADGNWAYVMGKRMERRRMIAQLRDGGLSPLRRLNLLRHILSNAFSDLFFGFGESMTKMVLTYIVTVFLFAWIFLSKVTMLEYGKALLVSLKNMVALDSTELSDVSPLIDMLRIVQTTIGILLTGIFGFILGNKIRNQ